MQMSFKYRLLGLLSNVGFQFSNAVLLHILKGEKFVQILSQLEWMAVLWPISDQSPTASWYSCMVVVWSSESASASSSASACCSGGIMLYKNSKRQLCF